MNIRELIDVKGFSISEHSEDQVTKLAYFGIWVDFFVEGGSHYTSLPINKWRDELRAHFDAEDVYKTCPMCSASVRPTNWAEHAIWHEQNGHAERWGEDD